MPGENALPLILQNKDLGSYWQNKTWINNKQWFISQSVVSKEPDKMSALTFWKIKIEVKGREEKRPMTLVGI